MDQTGISWLRLGILRLVLGMAGVMAGLMLGTIYMIVWHWAGLLIMFTFGWEHYSWAYAWDLVFLGALLYGGYRYKASMPPPLTDFGNLFQCSSRSYLLTPQGIWSVSEMLYIAPRFLFWGIRHLQRITWPSGEMAQTVERIHNALQSEKQGILYDQILGMGQTQEEGIRALAVLAKAELAQPWHHDGVMLVQASEPEWV